MKKLFSIGETATINKVSTKSLRYYDKIGLLKPAYIDKATRYRYYTYDQFAYIDKIKCYKSIGMPLKNIKEFFQTKSLEKIQEFLDHQRQIIDEETKKIEQLKNDVALLCNFFEHSRNLQLDEKISTRKFSKRFIIVSKCQKNEDMYKMGLDLRQVLANEDLNKIHILNPYGYFLDYDSILENKICFTHKFVSTNTLLPTANENIIELPEGEYICFKAAIFSENLKFEKLRDYLIEIKKKPKLIIACEYLKSFYDPLSSPYEIQLLF